MNSILNSKFLKFIVITFGYTWIVGGFVYFVLKQSYQVTQIAAMPGPAIGALLTIRMTEGSEEVRKFLRRIMNRRFSPIWYVLAITIPFLINGFCSLAAIIYEGASVPESWINLEFSLGFLVFFMFWNGFGEEIGWRGFALPLIQEKIGPLLGNLVLGMVWAVWHLPVFVIAGSYQYGSSFVDYSIMLISWSYMMAFLVDGARGSVLVAVLYHEAHNFIAFAIRKPTGFLRYYYPVTFFFVLITGFLWVIWKRKE